MHTRNLMVTLGLLATIGALSSGCAPAGPLTEGSPWVVERSIALDRPVDALDLLEIDGGFVLVEDEPENQLSMWTTGGREIGALFTKGRAPWQLTELESDVFRDPSGRIGVIDRRSYRVTFVDPHEGRLAASFVTSPHAFMPFGAVSDPGHGRIYVFANNDPEVRVLDFGGRLLGGFDFFDESYTSPYGWFRGALDSQGSLLYCPRTAYEIVKVGRDGTASLFARGDPEWYVSPLPLPDGIEDTMTTAERYRWESTVSWIDRVECGGGLVLVSYSMPPQLEDYRIDVFREDGERVHAGVPSPGRLLSCSENGSCWFLLPSHDGLVRMRVVS